MSFDRLLHRVRNVMDPIHIDPRDNRDMAVMLRGCKKTLQDPEIMATLRVMHARSTIVRTAAPAMTTWFESRVKSFRRG